MFALIVKGGPIMIGLLGCSIWGLFIIIYTWLYLNSNNIKDTQFIEKIKRQISSIGKEQSSKHLLQSQSLIFQSIGKVITLCHKPEDSIKHELQKFNQESLNKLDRNLNFLSSIITVAPILGLLGTVIGLMDIFNVISGGQIGDPTALSKGIAQALITTVTGLSIAVPFIFFHQFLNHKMDLFIRNINALIEETLQFLQTHTEISQ